MIQTVYVLKILRTGSGVRDRFARMRGAAQRAATGKYGLGGMWQQVQEHNRVASRLLGGQGSKLARVSKETLAYA